MNLSNEDFNRRSTYFGVFSATQAARISELLEGLGVRYDIFTVEQSEERLRAWAAWDPNALIPNKGYELYVHSHDLDKVGNRIIEAYPERRFKLE